MPFTCPPLILSVSLIGFSATAADRPPIKPKTTPRLRESAWSPASERPSEWSLTETLRDLIRAAFDADPHLPSGRIGIVVGAEMVALFGTVPDERAKRAAFELASSIPGAPPVRNRLRVIQSHA